MKKKMKENTMNFKETIINILYESPLLRFTEQAKQRYAVEQEVVGLGTQICKHILKCLMYGPNCKALKHWQIEINNWLNQIMDIKLKPKNKPVSKKYLLIWGMECLCDEFEPSERAFKGMINYLMTDPNSKDAIGVNLIRSSFKEVFALIEECFINARNGEYTIDKICEDWFQRHKDVYHNNKRRY